MDKFLFVNGMKLRYQEINPEASRPLVLLNGIGANLETWTPLLPHLGEYRLRIQFDGIRD